MIIADRYEPTGQMAWGGMAEVHTCTDHHLNRPVMLKRVKKTEDFSRLQDELKSLLKVRSPHVVELLDIVEYEYLGTPEHGLILELIVGHDLEEGSLPYGESYIHTLWQIAAGLADIHSQGIIHRDVKPQNIRRDNNGILKIIDFGLAREPDVDDKTRSIAGSMGYIAPELATLGEKSFTNAVDVFAFGVTALSLVVPIARQMQQLGPTLIDSVLPHAEADLKSLILSCVDKDPLNRPRMAEIRDYLERKLMFDRHRAWITVTGRSVEVSAKARQGTIKGGSNSLTIEYDGQDFKVKTSVGHVSINNRPATPGMIMNSSCLITLGAAGTARAFVPFDVSNPEIIA